VYKAKIIVETLMDIRLSWTITDVNKDTLYVDYSMSNVD